MAHRSNADVYWVVVAWLSMIVSGASTTGLLRAPLGTPGLGPAMLTGHMVLGASVGLIVVSRLLRSRHASHPWPLALVGAVVALGWFASRSFAPLTVAAHASLAAFSTVALAVATADASRSAMSSPPRTWKAVVARLGFLLMLLQIALGALLRHHLIGLTWHLLAGGLVAVAILSAAVAVTADVSATMAERRAARWAIATLLVQVSLGVAVLFMILIGTADAQLWLFTTIAHTVVASLTLLAAARLARALQTRLSPEDDMAPRARS